MSKRLYEVAKDLELSSTELTERIGALGLSFRVQNHLTVLTDEQIDELRDKLRGNDDAAREEMLVKKGVIRRRVRRRRVVVGEGDAGDIGLDDEGLDAGDIEPELVETIAEEVIDEPVAPGVVKRFATVLTREPDVPAEPEVAEVPVEADSVEDDEPAGLEPEPTEDAVSEVEDAPRRSRFATVVTREPVAAVPEDDAEARADIVQPAEPIVARSRFATVVTNPVGENAVASAAPSPMEMAAIARREADQRAAEARGRKGAKVVGTLSREVLDGRLDADRRDPGGLKRPVDAVRPERKAKKKGKRVVQSRDLYDGSRRNRKKGKGTTTSAPRITVAAEHKRVVKMEEAILVSELAHQMGIKAGEIAMKLMFDLGMKGANINTAIDFETAQLVAELYEYKVEQVGFDINAYLPKFVENDDDLRPRPAVVTIMGHVDHGKTSLLDRIRTATVATGEAGGITQHIGAYMVEAETGAICFLDTPGHEAFTALRARGAKATDIVVLVVAADDGVMPQTAEAINHAKDAEVPIIVAINKIDKPGANPERVKQALTEYDLVPEEWGGSTIYAETSALTGAGIDNLLDVINLQSEVLELRANSTCPARGLVIESKLDTGRGPVATVLVQAGTLKQGDIVVIGRQYGRIRTMSDEHGKRRDVATPSMPVEITGLSGVPESGENFYVVNEEKDAKTIADHVAVQNKQSELAQSVAARGGLDGIHDYIQAGRIKELKVIVKGDVQGSVEALSTALVKLSTDEVRVRIVHSGVGGITENDANLAASSEEDVGVIIIGFNVRPEARAQALADQLGVTIFTHSVIYEIIDQVRGLMTGLLEPVYVEEMLGKAEVRATFNIPRVGTVAGCMVTDGALERNARCRIIRDSIVVYESTIGSLRRFEEDVREVRNGFECGASIDRYNDLKVGDVIECFKLNETAATL